MHNRLPDALFTLTWVALAGLPLALAWTVATGGLAPGAVMAAFPRVAIAEAPSQTVAALVFAAGLAPWAAAMAALWHAQALFRLYRRGDALSAAAAGRVHLIGVAAVAAAGLGVIAGTVQVLLLTWANPPGTRALAIEIDGGVIGFLLAGGLLIVIGRSMAEAAGAVEENRSFV